MDHCNKTINNYAEYIEDIYDETFHCAVRPGEIFNINLLLLLF